VHTFPTGTVTFLFTDVVDSSRLWEEHPDAMRHAMGVHDEVMSELIEANSGLMVKQTGDGAFAVFDSAIDATTAATAIQAALTAQSWGPAAALSIRMGLHTGEAELRNSDYFGSAVNRAARVMGLGSGGQIYLSAATSELVKDRLSDGMSIRDLGDQDLRGMARPERVFELTTVPQGGKEAPSPAPPSRPTDPGDDRGRRAAWIAVLPFENMSGDPDQEYFSDGISEDIITGLSAWRSLRVVSRTSSFHYRGTDLSIGQIAEELGVQYVLEGSVRNAGGRVRVTAQLIEAATDHHVWADRYDGELEDIFNVQDQMTRNIVVAIDPAIRDAVAHKSARLQPDNLEAWDHVQRGWSLMQLFRKETNIEARRHFESAIGLDPNYAQAHAGLSWTHAVDAWLNWVTETSVPIERAYEGAKRAVESDSHDPVCHSVLALANYLMGRMDATLRSAERAIELNPSLATGYFLGGAAKIYGGDPEQGLEMTSYAIALSPRDPTLAWFVGLRAIGHFILENYTEATREARASIKLRHGYLFGRVVLTSSLAHLGDIESARSELDEILRINPAFSTDLLQAYTYHDESDRQRLIAGLRLAGLEE